MYITNRVHLYAALVKCYKKIREKKFYTAPNGQTLMMLNVWSEKL